MWYLVIVMGISLGFSFVLYNVTTNELAWGLHRETQRIYTQFPVFHNSQLLQPNDDLNNSARHILLRLIGFNLIVLAAAGGASYWLAKRTLEPIEAAHEQQKRFTADVSHELRTPLTAIRMETEVALMNSHTSPKELRETLDSNLEEVAKLEALINNLLRLSQLEADELQQNFTNVTVKSIVNEAVTLLAQQADERGVTIKQPTTKLSVFGDDKSLVQLIVILLDNAIKYSPRNAEIDITAQAQNDRIILRIKDHGAGIAPDELEHVFDRFYRADNSRNKGTHSGYGLGLSIAQMIADIHGAEITLQSRVEHGTTASISLPVAQVKPEADHVS